MYAGAYLPTYYTTPAYYFYPYVSGIYFGYCIFEIWHYFSHFGDAKAKILKDYKTLHVTHHYKVPYHGYGISNNFWDWVFDTELK